MTEAVVAVVDDNAPPPPELAMAWDVQRWGMMPDAGGLYDQDVVLLHRMTVFSNIYNVMQRLRSMDGAQIHSLSNAERIVLRDLRDQGII